MALVTMKSQNKNFLEKQRWRAPFRASLMKTSYLSLRNDDAPVGFQRNFYSGKKFVYKALPLSKKNTTVRFFLIDGHLIYCDTKGSIWHNISSNSLPALTTQTPWIKLP